MYAILGTTDTGQYEDIQEMDWLIIEKNKKEGLSVYIHVDVVSGSLLHCSPTLTLSGISNWWAMVQCPLWLRLMIVHSCMFAQSMLAGTNVHSFFIIYPDWLNSHVWRWIDICWCQLGTLAQQEFLAWWGPTLCPCRLQYPSLHALDA